jgi:hypothetical protein
MSGQPRWSGPRTPKTLGILAVLVALLAATLSGPATAAQPAAGEQRSTSWYQNPILPEVPGGGAVESCADPTVLHGQQPGDRYWYMYCTTDPLNEELSPVPAGWARYGNSVVGPPSQDWTYLRIVAEQLHGRAKADALGDTERYTAYTSQDGATWIRGGTWTHTLGKNARIGLVAMGQQPTTGGTFTADFDYVRVTTVRGGSRP